MRRLIIGMTGSTGAIFGVRMLEVLKACDIESHLIISKWAQRTLEHETRYTVEQVRGLANVVHSQGDMGASLSSGSFKTEGMVVIPCSVRTLGCIANGYGEHLVHRAADVVLKERRRLVLVVRETPLSEVHLENMLKLARMGASIVPPMPAFYNHPQTVDDIVNHIVARVLDQFDIPAPVRQALGRPYADRHQDCDRRRAGGQERHVRERHVSRSRGRAVRAPCLRSERTTAGNGAIVMAKFTYDHIHLRSPDPEATAQYYERMFGAEVLRSVQQGKPRIDLKLGGVNIFIAPVVSGDGVNPPPVTPYQGLDHFGLTVSGIDAVVAELKAKGAEFTREPTTVRPGVRVAFLRAPEGVSIELLDRNAG